MAAQRSAETRLSRPPAGNPSASPGPCRDRGVSRRVLLEGAAAMLTGIGAALAPGPRGAAVAATKISQKAAQYQDHPKGSQRCAICAHFVPPASCQLVAGKISPDGWCVLFAAKPSGAKPSG
jgi:hypothetical protein